MMNVIKMIALYWVFFITSSSIGISDLQANGKIIIKDFHFLDKSGKIVIKVPTGYHAERFSEGLAIISMYRAKGGFIDKTGKVVIEPKFGLPEPFSEGLARVFIGSGKLGYIDQKGNLVIPGPFDGAASFSEGLAAVSVGKKTGYIDKTGKMIIPPQFDEARKFSEDRATVRIGDKFALIDKTGKVIPFCPNNCGTFIHPFSEGLALAHVSNHGYIDKTGKTVITRKFDEAESFSEGLAQVDIGGKWGYLDNKGKLIILPQFDDCGRFSQGLAAVKD